MPDLNRVMLLGNVTRAPEIKNTPKGTAVLDLGIAVNETYKAQDGSTKETVLYVDVEVWGRQAENCCQYLHKGDPVFIEGRLRLEQWETKEGDKRKTLKVKADRVQFLRGPGGQRSTSSNDERSSGMSTRETRPAARPAPAHVDEAPRTPDDDDIPF